MDMEAKRYRVSRRREKDGKDSDYEMTECKVTFEAPKDGKGSLY